MSLSISDYLIFALYGVSIVALGLWVSRRKAGRQRSAEDYFLAGKSLPWWAIGASLIAANISAEQFIGMSGSGFAIGLAMASYEWMGAITLIVVGKYFLPIYIREGLYSVPSFLEKRYGTNLKSILALFWIAVFIFVNLTSVLYLGAKALDTVMGTGDGSLVIISIIGLALFAAAYSLWGGLSAVAWTDVLQVVLLVAGGLVTTCIGLDKLSGGEGIFAGFRTLWESVGHEKFSMVLSPGENIMPGGRDAYMDLPGLSVLLGGLWIANLYYFGFNQYIIQRALAAKNIGEAQKGMVFAAGLKMILPFLVIIPGMIAFAMYSSGMFGADTVFTAADGAVDADRAYPWLVSHFVPPGLKGLVLAALAAAIVSSLASMLNSTATIFTMDIYKPYFNRNASDRTTVGVGRITALVSLIIACCVAPMLGNFGQAFQYIQEYTGIVTPGILSIFLLGLFWRKTTNNAAVWGALISIVFGIFFKLACSHGILPPMPWMRQVEFTFLLTVAVMVAISLIEGGGKDSPKAIGLGKRLFRTGPSFNLPALAVLIILTVIYIIFW